MITADATQPEMHAPSGPAQCIEISGADARTFVQAQFAGDVRTLQPGRWQWNAWLDPKGSVRALMHLADLGDGRLLALMRGGDAQSFSMELQRYVLRAKVELEASNQWQRKTGAALPLGAVAVAADAIAFGYGDHSLRLGRDETSSDSDHAMTLRLADIRNGWPTLPPGPHAFLPPALGLEHLGAVSFGKGCYPGQEIAARLHYRGGHKLRPCHVRAQIPLTPGQPLSPAQPRAIVLDAARTGNTWEALAVLEESPEPLQGVETVRRFEA